MDLQMITFVKEQLNVERAKSLVLEARVAALEIRLTELESEIKKLEENKKSQESQLEQIRRNCEFYLHERAYGEE